MRAFNPVEECLIKHSTNRQITRSSRFFHLICYFSVFFFFFRFPFVRWQTKWGKTNYFILKYGSRNQTCMDKIQTNLKSAKYIPFHFVSQRCRVYLHFVLRLPSFSHHLISSFFFSFPLVFSFKCFRCFHLHGVRAKIRSTKKRKPEIIWRNELLSRTFTKIFEENQPKRLQTEMAKRWK